MRLGNVLPPADAAYGEEVAFARGRRLVYPDFSVEFLGKAHDLPLAYWRFEIRNEQERVEVRYGTRGVLTSCEFTVSDKRYALQLIRGHSAPPSTLVISEGAAAASPA